MSADLHPSIKLVSRKRNQVHTRHDSKNLIIAKANNSQINQSNSKIQQKQENPFSKAVKNSIRDVAKLQTHRLIGQQGCLVFFENLETNEITCATSCGSFSDLQKA